MENPSLKWMITGGTPMDRKPPSGEFWEIPRGYEPREAMLSSGVIIAMANCWEIPQLNGGLMFDCHVWLLEGKHITQWSYVFIPIDVVLTCIDHLLIG